MKMLDAAEAVLADAGVPLNVQEITQRAIAGGLLQSQGKTPADSIHAQLAVDIKQQGAQSRFQRTAKGVFALRQWGLLEFIATPSQKSATPVLSAPDVADAPPAVVAPVPPVAAEPIPALPPATLVAPKVKALAKPANTLSFTDAAEQVLKQFGGEKPMHYVAITKKALELGLIHTTGKTPEATLSAAVLTEIARATKRGEVSRFVKHGKGFIGLTEWLPQGLVSQIEKHNESVRKELLKQLHAMHAADFEGLITELLVRMGFDEVAKTPYSHDKGVDVRGTLVVGGVIRIRMAVQAKRWAGKVQSQVVQQVRGSLGSHERGLIITTSDFTPGAVEESKDPTKPPVALMNGEELVSLLIEHGLRAHREPYYLVELGDAEDE